MEFNGSTDLAVITGIVVGAVIAFPCGMFVEQQWGKSAEHIERLRDIIHRMIPKLTDHYTREYILWELIHGEEKRNGR